MREWRLVMTLVGGLVVGSAGSACNSKGGSSTYKPTGGSGGVASGAGGGGTLGLGVGEACTEDGECRSGLLCTDGTCQPAMNKNEGDECIISPECMDGLICLNGVCAPAGEGGDGDACTTDADCASGFRCDLQGFAAVCIPEGNVDIGGECTASGDCFGGLACVEGTCQVLPPGTPPFGLPWPGVDCPDPVDGASDALFRIPRAGATTDYFSLPFPNDVRKEGTTLDLADFPTPGDALLGFDPVALYVDAVEANNDGWGLYQGTIMRFTGRLDFDSIDQSGAVRLVDLTDGVALGLYWSYHTGRNKYHCHNRIHVRRSEGRIFEPGHTYAAYVTTLVRAENGDSVGRPSDLVGLLADNPPADASILNHYPKYALFRLYLENQSIDPDTILNATVFTAGNPRDVIEQLQTVIDSDPAPTASSWTLCDTGISSPCPDANGPRACEAADPDFHELHALVELPIFQEGTAPYLDSGGAINRTGSVPEAVRTENVCMSLTIPKATMPSAGFPTIVFAHGTGGHFRSHIQNGLAKSFGQGVADGQGTTVHAAVLGIDQVQHGPRRNGSDEEPQGLFFNFENPDAAKGNPQQGAADQMALLRFVPTIDFATSSPTGTAFNLTSAVAFWGHSQGGTHGGVATPYADWAGVVFTGHGGSLKDSLVSKTSPVNIAGVIPFVLQDFNEDGTLPHGKSHPVLELLQMYIDGGDPVAYNDVLALTPPPSIEAKHVFQLYGHDDTFSPVQTQRAYAGGLGIALVEHHGSVSVIDEIAGLDVSDELPLPASGNRVVNAKTVSVLLRQYAPSGSDDGHFVAFDIAEANDDALRFLAGSLSGVVPQVGP